ncbi:glutamate-5-semialdehyde dehydrogenase [Candidatus Peregrinibacteria bacterium]|nr:glutamate-5-semialdehyde dehydrogenase [Candidatus Peregrinibacteria bacterium]MBT4056239.1 glutamate-5-semialdehyde dehydrogenase [Candidatus Peregrinibacteria bacterium]
MIPNFKKAQTASRKSLSLTKRNQVLKNLMKNLKKSSKEIVKANAKDLAKMSPTNSLYDRLLLTPERIDAICADIRTVISLPDPTGKTIEKRALKNGLKMERRSVPLGVVGVIYEARPNVTVDVFSLCFKSGNAAVLKGGSDAENSNKAIVKVIKKSLSEAGVSKDYLYLMPSDRKYVEVLLKSEKYIDLIIPRGSQNLIRFVKENSLVPIIETGAGIVHTYVDNQFDLKTAPEVIFNAKTHRPSVCNALDCLVIHEKSLPKLPKLTQKLTEKNVTIYADPKAYAKLTNKYPKNLLKKATKSHFGKEFLSLKMAIKTVRNLDEAVEHINTYSSRHSEAILSNSLKNQERFINEVDASTVYTNASTRFTDGSVFGLGAEIGISTQKLHARGPFALDALTTYKWILRGKGHSRG